MVSHSYRDASLRHLYIIPDGPSLEVYGSTGENSSGNSFARLTAVHHALGHRGEIPDHPVNHRFVLTPQIGTLTRCRGRWWHHSQADGEPSPRQGSPG